MESYTQIESHLQILSNNRNITSDIENFISTWIFSSEYDLLLINEDIAKILESLKDEFFPNCDDSRLSEHLYNIVHIILWPHLKSVTRAKYIKEDNKLIEKSDLFCKNQRNLAMENSENSYCSVPYTAAIVELSMLNFYKTPLQKLNCLCTVYDIIFAELKSALINIISKYSEKELEIPIINNEEITPVIFIILMKSKLKYLYSDLMYNKIFGLNFIMDKNKCYILEVFDKITNEALADSPRFSNLLENRSSFDTNYISILEKITVADTVGNKDSGKKPNLEEERQKEFLNLILSSTQQLMK